MVRMTGMARRSLPEEWSLDTPYRIYPWGYMQRQQPTSLEHDEKTGAPRHPVTQAGCRCAPVVANPCFDVSKASLTRRVRPALSRTGSARPRPTLAG